MLFWLVRMSPMALSREEPKEKGDSLPDRSPSWGEWRASGVALQSS